LQHLTRRHVDLNRDPSVAVKAVYRQWFPWLVLLDAQWAAVQKTRIFFTALEHTTNGGVGIN